MFKLPPKTQLRKILGKTVTLKKYTYSGTEDEYGQKERTLSDSYSIKAEIQELTSEDLAFLPPGLANIGDAYGYFLPSYLAKGKTVEISTEDEIVWNNKTWRIDRVEDYYYGDKIWYKRAFLRRVI